ncbi:MAG: 30S ribosomal protein S12 methylthiotransferase RimO [Thermodesulfobacteria bacterium]|nr:30S ribosomal protein S12 methylthiotransferase RimO [Thermodesulfobacteriota bacterium]
MPKIYPVSLGCAKNKADFEKLLYVLISQGWEPVLTPEEADVIWINTCAFIRPAVEEAIDHIIELGSIKQPGQKLVVSGCLTARYGKEKLKTLLPEVDEFFSIEPFQYFSSSEPIKRILSENPFYAYLKIAEGCNKKCSYCTIPFIRGKLRSKPLDFLIKEARYLIELGVKELILVAQDTTSYGLDFGEKRGLLKLIKALDSLKGDFRIRLLYCYPSGLNKKLVKELLEVEKLVPYFDIPIQHSHPEVLKRMRRPANSERLKNLIDYIRDLKPETGIRTTVIVGFPGESEEEFEHLLNFLKTVEFDYLGAFIFYPEEGTLAEKLTPKVKYKEKVKRKRLLLKLQKEITKKRLAHRIGQEEEVLVLGSDIRGRTFGISRFQAPEIDGVTYITTKKEILPGELIKGKIVRSGTYDVWIRPV